MWGFILETVVQFLIWLVRKLPLKGVRWLGSLLGRCAYFLARRGRRTAHENLSIAYGDALTAKQRKRIAKKSFSNLLTTALEICWGQNLPRDADLFIDPKNKQTCLDLYAEGKGVILIVPHMGNWEVCARWLTQNLPAVHAVVRKQKEPWIERMLQTFRNDTGLSVIYNQNSLRQVLSVLRHGELVILMIDQHMRKGAVQVEFFGHPAMTTASAALLAIKTGCRVLAGCCYRDMEGNWEAMFSDPIETIVTNNRDHDYIQNTQNYVSLIEEMVRQHPEDWMWMHRRWRKGKQRNPRRNP